MKKKNGFTLIELLAILVILAIIAVITIPKINKVINESKQNAARNSAYGYKDAIEKWEASQQEDDIYLNGNYTITNGKLDNYTIPITGSAPSSGYLTYEDDDLISGCLVINGYEAIYQNGKFTSTGKGDCGTPTETFLYYTYDPNAQEGPNGYITSKLPQPNASWTYYIKETTQTVDKYYYTTEGTVNGETMQQGSFESLSECEAELNTIPQEVIEENNIKCVKINTITTNEVCGVENGTTFCLKPNDYANSVTTLNTIFPGCNSSNNETQCAGNSIFANANMRGDVNIFNYNSICEIRFLYSTCDNNGGNCKTTFGPQCNSKEPPSTSQ